MYCKYTVQMDYVGSVWYTPQHTLEVVTEATSRWFLRLWADLTGRPFLCLAYSGALLFVEVLMSYQPGQCGNSGGRPPGAKTRCGGVSVNTKRALLKQMQERAMDGDTEAQNRLFEYAFLADKDDA